MAQFRDQFRTEDLDRDLATVPPVFSEIDGGHPADAEHTLEAVPVVE